MSRVLTRSMLEELMTAEPVSLFETTMAPDIIGHETPPAVALITQDQITKDLIIQNGLSKIVLKQDGTIRIEGVRIVNIVSESISLHAATIDLN
jgi:hypothetical protein